MFVRERERERDCFYYLSVAIMYINIIIISFSTYCQLPFPLMQKTVIGWGECLYTKLLSILWTFSSQKILHSFFLPAASRSLE